MLLVLDFDGVFAPINTFWQALNIYGEKKKIKFTAAALVEIKKNITKNQEELSKVLGRYGCTDLTALERIYYKIVTLKTGALNLLHFCCLKKISYIFFSGANPQRILSTFGKFRLKLNSEDIHYASQKDDEAFLTLKSKLWQKYGKNDPIIYVDDYPPALLAGKKTGYITVLMLDDSSAYDGWEKEADNGHIDYRIRSFVELEAILNNFSEK